MRVVVRSDAVGVVRLAAWLIAAQIQAKPQSVLGFATGRTMEHVYGALVRLHEAGKADFSRCTSFNLDEYIGVEATDPRSYRSFMNRALFTRVNIDRARTHLPDGMASDRAAAAIQYESAIRSSGGIDLQIVGIGENGHIGFNEPLSALRSRTRDVTLAPRTLLQNAATVIGGRDFVPPRAITMGIATILDARRIVLIATGAAKAPVLARAIEGPLTAAVSCSALQTHADCLVIADEVAATDLTGRTYYDHVCRFDPDLVALPTEQSLAADERLLVVPNS